MELIFKSIPGLNGYFAGSDGHIYTAWYGSRCARITTKLKKLSAHGGSSQYLMVHPKLEINVYTNSLVHRLVCFAFHGPPKQNDFTCSHLNGNRLDNRPDNLIWESLEDNQARKIVHGTYDGGYLNSRAKITKTQLVEIRELLKVGVYTHEEIGNMYNVNRVFITKINCKNRYAKV